MIGSELLEVIPFDLYERYSLVEGLGERFQPAGGVFRVLDFGGFSETFWKDFPSLAGVLIPHATVVVADTLASTDLSNSVRAEGIRLPFRDSSFDLVFALDSLASIPAESRPLLLAELLRVTRDGLYVTFPFDSPSNRWANSVVAGFADIVMQDSIPALTGRGALVERESISRFLVETPCSCISFEHGNTEAWLFMMLTAHSLRSRSADFEQALNRRFKTVYAGKRWNEPHYRADYLLSKRRSKLELEALREVLVPLGETGELQSVLAYCQLLLGVAHNAKLSAEKDRHTRKTERDLAALREVAAKWEQSASVLKLVPEINAELSRMRAEIAALRNRVEYITRLDDRMRDLELGLVTNKRAIQAIYDSRIWKAFCKAGALALRLGGRRTRPDKPFAWSPETFQASLPAQEPGDSDDFVGMTCDYPGDSEALPVRDVVEIRGWVLARSGIERVRIQIGDAAPETASYGIPRPDVAHGLPEFIDAAHSGYRYFWDTSGLPEGPCTIRITATARSGQTRELMCRARIDWRTPPDYGLWIARHEPSPEDLRQMRIDVGILPSRPVISIVVPVYKTPAALLTRCVESVMDQVYSNWELCLVDDGSNDDSLTALLAKFEQCDSRIKIAARPKNGGIAAATNDALGLAAGDYVAFLDHDDELAPFALAEVVRAINTNPDTDIFYSDEDKIDDQGRRYDAFFKPDWSPDLFRACNYICHFLVMRRAFLREVGGLDERYSGSQDYEFLLRANEQTQRIKRIPKILYHWRAITGSTAKASSEKPEASADGLRALEHFLDRNAPGAQVEEVGACRYRVRYPIVGNPRVSILIPTGGHKNVYRAVSDVVEKTAYKNFEILLIDNSRSSAVLAYAERLVARKAPVRHFDWRGKPFNFAEMNNAAARSVGSPYLLFLNDDTSIITPEWLGAMLEHAQHSDVGAVGAQLWFPNNLIQHAGVIMGIFGNCSHAFKGLPGGVPHYFDFPNLIRNCSAVTGACLLVGREKFFEAGAFDEVNLAVAFQDVDLCLKLHELGYRNVYTPYAKLYHFESATKTDKDKIPDPQEDAFMKKKWARYIADDPYYNPNLARMKEDFSLAVD